MFNIRFPLPKQVAAKNIHLVNVTSIPFHLMPEAFKRAVSHYFSVEGDIETEVVEGREYGITEISMDKLTQSIMEDDGIKGRFKAGAVNE